jgi:uncharacterized protein GlcG (DUF336 family)
MTNLFLTGPFGRALIGAALVAAALLAPSQATAQATGKRLTLSDARAVIAAAQKSATAKNLQVTVVVVDYRGDVIALERQPGANPESVDGAIGKAMLSAIFLRPSGTFRETTNSGSPITAVNESTGGRLRFGAGGVPIVRGGVLIGAVAVGGATPPQDETVANDGAAAIP